MASINIKALNPLPPKSVTVPTAATPDVDGSYGPPPRAIVKKFAGAYYSGALRWLGEFDPDHITYEQMYMMRRDPMIKMAQNYILAPLANAPWRCEAPDPTDPDQARQAAFAEQALQDIYISAIKGYFTKLDFGHTAMIKRFKKINPEWTFMNPVTNELEPVWEDEDIQAIVWDDPRVIPPETAWPNFTADGEQFAGIFYKPGWNMRDNKTILQNGVLVTIPDQTLIQAELIPPGNCLWAVNEREESFNNWAGYPRSGYAFRYWWTYWFRWILADRHFERDADPPMKVTYPPGMSEDEQGHLTQNADTALQMGDLVRDGATLAFPSTVYMDDLGKPTSVPLWDAEFLQGGENMAVYQASFEYLDVMKLRSMLVPEGTLIESKGTTTPTTGGPSSYSKTFTESLGMLMNEFDRDVNKYFIPDLLSVNFKNPVAIKKVTTGFRSVDIDMAGSLLQYIANQSGSTLPIDVRQLLEDAGIPTIRVTNQSDPLPTAEGADSNSPTSSDSPADGVPTGPITPILPKNQIVPPGKKTTPVAVPAGSQS